MPHYVAHVTTTTPTATDPQLDALVDHLAPHAGVPSLHGGRLSVHLDVDAPDLTAAAARAVDLTTAALHTAGITDPEVAAVDVLTVAEQARRLDLPAPPHDLVSTAQAGVLLGVSRQRVLQLADQHEHFPRPVRLGRGLYWSRSALRRFEAVWRHGQGSTDQEAS